MRATFPFEFELEGGVCVSGTFRASNGFVDDIEFSDGECVETGSGTMGRSVASAKTPFLLALSNAVLTRIYRRFQHEIYETRSYERPYEPIRIGQRGMATV